MRSAGPSREPSSGRRIPLERVPAPPPHRLAATWRQADPERIEACLQHAQARDPGGWYVAATSADVAAGTSTVRDVAGQEVMFWRAPDATLHAGPGACPHLGARLDGCPVTGSVVHCRWHGLALTPQGLPDWRPYPAVDDGVLVWVRLPTRGETAIDQPRLTRRPPPAQSVAAVIRLRGRCEPQDVIANRLDPWHGSWFHPYAFSHLRVDEAASTYDTLALDVTFRLGTKWGVPVRAEFSCPDARTIAMHIVDGEGAGSVVETHATPIGTDHLGAPVTDVIEATIAHSERSGFQAARRLQSLMRPAMRRVARRLWVDDMVYAERRYELRAGERGLRLLRHEVTSPDARHA
ncbi:DUF5914 domain-containing protein [uncultured Jatrophihabitans sp.]|uniref:DUF5914 domain-containing protein n=1 Tax=uncultured Jatrophihabitans sp. TaxID=1610747 RepID=UPI0035CA5AF7